VIPQFSPVDCDDARKAELGQQGGLAATVDADEHDELATLPRSGSARHRMAKCAHRRPSPQLQRTQLRDLPSRRPSVVDLFDCGRPVKAVPADGSNVAGEEVSEDFCWVR
jgi:hypothetical protein